MSSIAHVGHKRETHAGHVTADIIASKLVDSLFTARVYRLLEERIVTIRRLEVVPAFRLVIEVKVVEYGAQPWFRERLRELE